MNQDNKIRVSIGIPAYNEGQNIGKLLEALIKQELRTVHISQIMVIASGCTDDTVETVKRFQRKHRDLELIVQEQRAGKSAAVNLFLERAKEDICVVESADTIPTKKTVEELCAPFANGGIGMSGAHPMPTNEPDTLVGFCIQTMWEMHHQIALRSPKCGEMIAFRRVFKDIPSESAVDEASIEVEITKKNLKIIYVPNAIVYNKGPVTVREFIAQRRRVNVGHIWLKKHYGHRNSTGDNAFVLLLVLKQFSLKSIRNNVWLICMILFEAWSRLLAYKDYYLGGKQYSVWDRIAGSKNPNIN